MRRGALLPDHYFFFLWSSFCFSTHFFWQSLSLESLHSFLQCSSWVSALPPVPQLPQSMHNSGSMTCKSLRSPLIALVGHRLMQAVQPVQFSVMMKAIR